LLIGCRSLGSLFLIVVVVLLTGYHHQIPSMIVYTQDRTLRRIGANLYFICWFHTRVT
jgi:hypothetical protein